MSETQTIQRFRWGFSSEFVDELRPLADGQGEWMRFDDHARLLAEKDALIARLQARLQTRPFQDHGEAD